MSNVLPYDPKATPYVGNNFYVELAAVKLKGEFTNAGGLSIDVEVVDIPGSSKDNAARKRAGTAKYGDITLKRNLTQDKSFYEWADKLRKGMTKEYRSDGSIVLYSQDGKTEIARWNFTNAWPSKWSVSDPDASKADPLVEEVTLAIETLERVK
jgi:phage tail-like protein